HGDGAVSEAATLLEGIREQCRQLFNELARVRKGIGRDGRLTERLTPPASAGAWAAGGDSANATLGALTGLTSEMARVVGAVAKGDLNARVDVKGGDRPLRGDLLRMARSVNHMVEQLDLFTGEVTQVARNVGTEGRLGGQARVRGMSG